MVSRLSRLLGVRSRYYCHVMSERTTLHPYTPPQWATGLANPPPHRLKLAQLPTPIRKWNVPGVSGDFSVSIKRDDLTGAALSGNKIRKLEFLLADALHQGCDNVVTIGAVQSNHCRATAVASRQLGLQPHLLIRAKEMDPAKLGCHGNLLIDRLVGSEIVLCPYRGSDDKMVDGKRVKGMNSLMKEYADILRSKGHTPYCIPIGGCNPKGTWGYIEGFNELIKQGVCDNYDDIVVAVGSGGTVTGIAIGNYLTGSKVKVHGVCVCDNAEYFYDHIDGQLTELGLTQTPSGGVLKARDIIDLIDGYKGLGYAQSTDEELAQLVDISGETGIVLDRVYTLKGVRGMLGEMKSNSSRFQGRRVLFIHTGGLHSIFDGTVKLETDGKLDAFPEQFMPK